MATGTRVLSSAAWAAATDLFRLPLARATSQNEHSCRLNLRHALSAAVGIQKAAARQLLGA